MNWSTQQHWRRTVDLLMIPFPAFWFPDTFLKALCSLFPFSTLCPAFFFFFYLCPFYLWKQDALFICFLPKWRFLFHFFFFDFLFLLSCCFCSSSKDRICLSLSLLLFSISFCPRISLSPHLSSLLHFLQCFSYNPLFPSLSPSSHFPTKPSYTFVSTCKCRLGQPAGAQAVQGSGCWEVTSACLLLWICLRAWF